MQHAQQQTGSLTVAAAEIQMPSDTRNYNHFNMSCIAAGRQAPRRQLPLRSRCLQTRATTTTLACHALQQADRHHERQLPLRSSCLQFARFTMFTKKAFSQEVQLLARSVTAENQLPADMRTYVHCYTPCMHCSPCTHHATHHACITAPPPCITPCYTSCMHCSPCTLCLQPPKLNHL